MIESAPFKIAFRLAAGCKWNGIPASVESGKMMMTATEKNSNSSRYLWSFQFDQTNDQLFLCLVNPATTLRCFVANVRVRNIQGWPRIGLSDFVANVVVHSLNIRRIDRIRQPCVGAESRRETCVLTKIAVHVIATAFEAWSSRRFVVWSIACPLPVYRLLHATATLTCGRSSVITRRSPRVCLPCSSASVHLRIELLCAPVRHVSRLVHTTFPPPISGVSPKQRAHRVRPNVALCLLSLSLVMLT